MTISRPGPLERGNLFSSRKSTHFIDREFQIRYILMVLAAVVIGSAAAFVPLYYFLEDNYKIFFTIAETQAPAMLDNLEREKLWLQLVIAAGAMINFAFFAFMSLKLTARVIGPLKVLKNHLQMLSRGYWNQSPIKVRDQDEFQDLIESYNYFFLLIKTQLEKERDLLQKIQVDPRNNDSFEALQKLLASRSLKLDRIHDERSELAG